mmetsp:Transcript_28503/g.92387  ORF Transcript_28503/g.92387 Transcript_28503/m.92387 type:complete len:489 (+) Transcript_28503:24-1490(+)
MRSLAFVVALLGATSALAVQGGGEEIGACSFEGLGHVWTFENENYQVLSPGTYVAAKSKDGFFEVQIVEGEWKDKTISAGKSVAVRCAKDIVEMKASGGAPMETSPRVELLFNGKALSIAAGSSKRVRDFKPDERHVGLPGVLEVGMEKHNSEGMSLVVKCNKRTLDDPGTFEVGVDAKIESNTIHSDFVITADTVVYSDGHMTGFCGWLEQEDDNAIEAEQCKQLQFKSPKCHELVTVDAAHSLFQDPEWHEVRKTSPPSALNEERMAAKRSECTLLFDQVIPSSWLQDLPFQFGTKARDLVKTCTLDGYYGLEYKEDDFQQLVCSEAIDRVDKLRRALSEDFQSIRCALTYESALKSNGTTNVRMANEYFMSHIDKLRFQVTAFCQGPCTCKATEAQPNSPNNVPCDKLPATWRENLEIRMGLRKPKEDDEAKNMNIPEKPRDGVSQEPPAVNFLEEQEVTTREWAEDLMRRVLRKQRARSLLRKN